MGKFIDIEGIDACGKSTVVPIVFKELKARNVNIEQISKKNKDYDEEKKSFYAKTLHDLTWNDPNNNYSFITSLGWLYQLALWYTFVYENYVKHKILSSDLVLVDGWFYKMYCRFAIKKDFNKQLLDVVYHSIAKCHMVFLIDEQPLTCWSRRSAFSVTEMGGFDNRVGDKKTSFVEYQSKVRSELLKLADSNNWYVIKCNNYSPEIIAREIVEIIMSTN